MRKTIPISAVLITKNASGELPACLDSLKFCDEILVVDSGSEDATAKVALSCGARVIQSEWRGFGRQKQFAVEQAANDWVLCIDADERVSPNLRDSILEAMEIDSPQTRSSNRGESGKEEGYPPAPTHNSVTAYRFARCNRFLGRYLRHGEGYPDWSLRLFDRRAAQWSDDVVHEKVVVNQGVVGALTGDLMHASAEHLHNYPAKQNRYSSLAADAARLHGKRATVAQVIFSPLLRFVKFYFIRGGFLDGAAGLVHVMIGCIASFSKYAKMLAEQRKAD